MRTLLKGYLPSIASFKNAAGDFAFTSMTAMSRATPRFAANSAAFYREKGRYLSELRHKGHLFDDQIFRDGPSAENPSARIQPAGHRRKLRFDSYNRTVECGRQGGFASRL
jgi:hypothetical protein